MNYELTDKEHFIRKFFQIILFASALANLVHGTIKFWGVQESSLFLSMNVFLGIFSTFLFYYLIFKRHNNFIPTLFVYLIPIGLLMAAIVLPWYPAPFSKEYYEGIISGFSGMVAHYALCWYIRPINQKIQFQRKWPEDFAEWADELSNAATPDELQKLVDGFIQKFPKFKLFFKRELKARSI